MFVDMVDSTALGFRIDPEELREVMRAYHTCIADIVEGSGGYVARYMGDGVLAYFGYPRAHEDDAQRAIRAGVMIVDAVARLDTAAGAPGTIATRVGIATGVVVIGDLVGEGASAETFAVGNTPNMAARLQVLAAPNSLVVDNTTRHIARLSFEYKPIDAVRVKGIDVPIEAWAVLGETSTESRSAALRLGQAALVGRTEELGLLVRRWEQVKDGKGRCVLLLGEAGIGKTRLVAALQQSLDGEPFILLRVHCSEHMQDAPFFPIVSYIRDAAGLAPSDPPALRRRKLRNLFDRESVPEEEFSLIADLVSPPRETATTDNWSPQRRKERIFTTLLNFVVRRSLEAPVLLVLEDAHWSDASTMEFLEVLIDRLTALRVLVLITGRLGVEPAWVGQSHVTVQMLNCLDRRESIALILEVCGSRIIPQAVIDRIIRHSDGIPLFVEELTKAVINDAPNDQGVYPTTPLSPDQVPTTLHASLMARLDRITSAKQIAQLGAVIGREFSFSLLRSVSDLTDQKCNESLLALADAGILTVRGTPPGASYVFNHALVQDAAYSSLLRDRRRTIHARIAKTLESDPNHGLTQPELMAWHWAEASEPEKAIHYYLRAAELASGRSALAEIVNNLRKALIQHASQPDGSALRQREVGLQIALGRALIDHRGSGRDEVHAAYARARELCVQIGESEPLLRVHDGLINFHFTRSESDKLFECADEMRQLSVRSNNAQASIMARRSAALAHMLVGQFSEACVELGELLNEYQPSRDGPLAALTTRDTRVSMCTVFGICLTALGHLELGTRTSMDGLTHAEHLNHIVSLVLALRRVCVQRMMLRDCVGAFELSERLFAVSNDYETYLGTREGKIFNGWSVLMRRFDAEVLDQMQLCFSELAAAKHWVMLPFFMASAADALIAHGQNVVAADLVDRSAKMIAATGERWCEAEILRLQARLSAHGLSEKERILQQCLAVAQRQGAKLWELRAAVDLANLWRDQGQRAQATRLLEPVFRCFDEASDYPDVQAAKMLLTELAQP